MQLSYNACMKTTVSEKGQVTIPKRLRERLGIRPGDVLNFEEDRGKLVATKQAAEDPMDALYGSLRDSWMMREFGSVDAFIDAIRGPADIPDRS